MKKELVTKDLCKLQYPVVQRNAKTQEILAIVGGAGGLYTRSQTKSILFFWTAYGFHLRSRETGKKQHCQSNLLAPSAINSPPSLGSFSWGSQSNWIDRPFSCWARRYQPLACKRTDPLTVCVWVRTLLLTSSCCPESTRDSNDCSDCLMGKHRGFGNGSWGGLSPKRDYLKGNCTGL